MKSPASAPPPRRVTPPRPARRGAGISPDRVASEDVDEELGRLLARLKRAYRAAGLRYADAARSLGVSEMTIKRHMAGRGLTVRTLQRLCAVADLTLAELVELGGADAGAQELVTPDQARGIAGDIVLGMILYLLTRGWPADRIARELRLAEPGFTGHLLRLDRLGVIALYPGNRVRLLRRMSPDIRQEATTFDLVARRVHQFFDRPDLHDPDIAWTSGIARLSPASRAQAAHLLDQFRDAVFALGERDLDLPGEAVTWTTLFAAIRPVAVEQLLYEEAAPTASG